MWNYLVGAIQKQESEPNPMDDELNQFEQEQHGKEDTKAPQ
jgi:hypothetical protein